MAAPSTSDSDAPPAKLGARLAAYLIDSVVLLVFLLLFFIIGGAVLLLASDWGREDPPDAAFTAFIATLIGGPVIFWSLFNLVLDGVRAQSVGMYFVGIRVTPERRRPGAILLRWFGLNPMLYHPLLIPVFSLLSAYATSVTLNRGVLVLTLAVALLCIAAPIAGLAAMALDGEQRGVHDRLGRTRVVATASP